MRDFFSLDGAFSKYGGFIADMLILSLMWIFFSIPIVTMGAATTAMFYVSTRRIANREGYITSDFWASFKANFVRATILWLIIMVIGGVLIFNILNMLNTDLVGETMSSFMLPAQIIFLVELTLITVYIFPVTARFEMGIWQTIRSCFFMANRHLLTSIICGALLIAVIFASLMQPLIFFVAPGIYALLASYMLMRIFKRYRPEMDRDPALELAEMEAERAETRRKAEILNLGGDEMLKTMEMRNKNGMEVTVTNLGCAIMSLKIPVRGKSVDVVLGLDSAEDYKKAHPFFGVVCGRVANRIGQGKFQLGGTTYQLETNDGEHHLHGGTQGFDKKVWDVESADESKIVFVLNSPDGDSDYPGAMKARVTYTLTDDNTFGIGYSATAESETICNMTNHSYFNLDGHDAPNIYDHKMQIFASKITAVDEGLIPTGDFNDITGTPFDFRTAKPLGQDLEAAGAVNSTGGYDHNYVLDGKGLAAEVYSGKTGITMQVETDLPGIQLYTANFVDGTVSGKGVTYQKHSGFCLETQFFPDAVNKPNFASPIIKPLQTQSSYTQFKFKW